MPAAAYKEYNFLLLLQNTMIDENIESRPKRKHAMNIHRDDHWQSALNVYARTKQTEVCCVRHQLTVPQAAMVAL